MALTILRDPFFEPFMGFEHWKPSPSSSSEREWRPHCDVRESERYWHICVELAGLAKNDVHLELKGNSLTIRGERRKPSKLNPRIREEEKCSAERHEGKEEMHERPHEEEKGRGERRAGKEEMHERPHEEEKGRGERRPGKEEMHERPHEEEKGRGERRAGREEKKGKEEEKREEKEELHRHEKKKKRGWLIREVRHGNFERSFSLPEGIRFEEIKATMRHGLLHIEIPKREAAKEPHKITIE